MSSEEIMKGSTAAVPEVNEELDEDDPAFGEDVEGYEFEEAAVDEDGDDNEAHGLSPDTASVGEVLGRGRRVRRANTQFTGGLFEYNGDDDETAAATFSWLRN